MAAVVSSLCRVLGGKRAAAAAAGNEPREKKRGRGQSRGAGPGGAGAHNGTRGAGVRRRTGRAGPQHGHETAPTNQRPPLAGFFRKLRWPRPLKGKCSKKKKKRFAFLLPLVTHFSVGREAPGSGGGGSEQACSTARPRPTPTPSVGSRRARRPTSLSTAITPRSP